MIGRMVDSIVSAFDPLTALQRAQARRVLRQYQGAESNRLTNHKKPKNQSANQELSGPFGADALRSWARSLVRDNAYAWGVVDTIVSSVIGNGITPQSTFETPAGEDVENVNELRDASFAEWCEVCDINGQLTFAEIQALCQREIVEAGEVLVRFVRTPGATYRGITRPIPLALEVIEADRLAVDVDRYRTKTSGENRIIRGVEVDDTGKPVAYHIYKAHPSEVGIQRTPEIVPANQIRHLFRQDRVGQTRGVTWFAPVMSWLRDLALYVDNEIQASAVASCFGVVIKSNGTIPSLAGPSDEDTTDANGNSLQYLEPGIVTHLGVNEDISCINPSRPNAASEPWINLMLRGIAVGTGLSYEIVSRDYSKTSYSSSRSSQLEDRRRFRMWQRYMVNNLCQPVWDEFCTVAAISGLEGFPSTTELLDSRRKVTPVEWQTPEWEWVDPSNEQNAARDAIQNYMSTYSDELGSRGRSWRATFYQAAKEKKLRLQLGLATPEEIASVQSSSPQQPQDASQSQSSGEWMGLSRLQWNRNRKALQDVLDGVADGSMSPEMGKAQLAMLGLTPQNADAVIADVSDGTVSNPLPEAAQ